jgi:type II secretory pathway predicted ATPase ExeA
MYKSFFGLRENPFNGNPDPRYLYFTPHTRKAMEQLTYGVQHCKGLILLTGEVGTGKTTLINHLLNWLRAQNTPTAFIFNSHLTVNHLLDFILSDFGVPIDFRLNGNMLMRLKLWLLEHSRAGNRPVLIVDEAQGLSIEALEEIRLLLNLETDADKLLQIVLVGQPELEEKLKLPELAQLRQRIELRCSTAPLRLEESRCYIAERLRIAGTNGNPIFAAETVDAAHLYSKGIPRVLNLLCEHALINAFAAETRQVPAWAVEEAARDFHLIETRPTAPRQWGESTGENAPAIRSTREQELMQPFAATETELRESAHDLVASEPTVGDGEMIEGLASANQNAAPNFIFSARLGTVRLGENGPPAGKKILTFHRKNVAGGPAEAIPVPSVVIPTWIHTLIYVLELRTRVFVAVQRNRQAQYVRKIMGRWIVDFRKDWTAMMKAVEFSESARALLQWLRQPAAAASKRMESGK